VPNYFVDQDGATAYDPDGGGRQVSINMNNDIIIKVFRGTSLMGTFTNISFPWTTPIDIDISGRYTIEYAVTDNRGATSAVYRTIEVDDGVLSDTTTYKNLQGSVAHGILGAGYHQSLSSDGQWAACNFIGNFENDYNEYDTVYGLPFEKTPESRVAFNAHGAIVFNVSNFDNNYIMQVQKVLGYWKVTGSTQGGVLPNQLISGNNTSYEREIGERVKWWEFANQQQNAHWEEHIVDIVKSDTDFRTKTNVNIATSKAIFTSVYSAAPGKHGKIADIASPDDSAPSIVPREPIVINGSPYTAARNIEQSSPSRMAASGTAKPEGFAWTMRYSGGTWIVDGFFSTPYAVDQYPNNSYKSSEDYRRFGRNVEISGDGSTIAIHSAFSHISAGTGEVYIYRRTGVFSHIAYYSSNTKPSTPSTSSSYIPTGWSATDTNSPYSSGGWRSRAYTTNNGSTYIWGEPYQPSSASKESHPHSGNIHTNIHNEYGWTKIGTLSGLYTFGESMDFSKDGNTIVIGDPYTYIVSTQSKGQVKVFQYNGSSWSQKGSTITSPVNNAGYGLYEFGISVACDNSGDTVIVGSLGQTVLDSTNRVDQGACCFQFVNGSWYSDSIYNEAESHKDATNYLGINYVQSHSSSGMYHTPHSIAEHGRYVAISPNGERMYVLSRNNQSIPFPVESWTSGTTYTKDQIIKYNNAVWRAKQQTNAQPSSSSSDWRNISTYLNGLYDKRRHYILGYADQRLNAYHGTATMRGSVFVYKKTTSTQTQSGYYWKFEANINVPESMGYNGWELTPIDSVAVSDDDDFVLIGSSYGKKYGLLGESDEGDIIGHYVGNNMINWVFPGAWVFARKGDVATLPDYGVNYDTFLANYSHLLPDQYQSSPNISASSIFVLQSLNPGSSFIIYISQPRENYRQASYIYYLGGTDTTTPSASSSSGSQAYEIYDENALNIITPIEVPASSSQYFWLRMANNNVSSDWSSMQFYDSSAQITQSPVKPDVSLSYEESNGQAVFTLQHFIDQNFNIAKQSKEYIISEDAQGLVNAQSISADYSQAKLYIYRTFQRGPFFSSDPSENEAEIKTFYVTAKNDIGSDAQLIPKNIYTYNWSAFLPQNPISFNALYLGNYRVLLFCYLPYVGYNGSKPDHFEIFMTNNSLDVPTGANTPTLLHIPEFNSEDMITSQGFRHDIYLESNIINTNDTYYFWIKSEGVGTWLPAAQNSTGGVTVT